MNSKQAKKLRQIGRRSKGLFTKQLQYDLRAMPMIERFKFCYKVLRMPRHA